METLSVTQELEPKVFESLGQCALFRALKPEQLPQLLKVAELQAFEPGETIVRQGEPSDSFYIVIDGKAAVTVQKGDGEAVEIGRDPAALQRGRGGPPPQRAAHGLRHGQEPRAGPQVLEQGLRGDVPEDPAVRGRAGRGPGPPPATSSRARSRSRSCAQPKAPAAEVLDMLPVELIQRHRVLPLRVDDNVLTLGRGGHADDAGHQGRQRPAARPRDQGRADPGRLLQRGAQPARRSQGLRGQVPPLPPRSPPPSAVRRAWRSSSSAWSRKGPRTCTSPPGTSRTGASTATCARWTTWPCWAPNEVLELLEPVMEARHRQQFAEDNDTDLAYALPGSARFRVNVFRDRFGVSAVLRQIPSKILTFEQLSLPPVLKTLCDCPRGWCWSRGRRAAASRPRWPR